MSAAPAARATLGWRVLAVYAAPAFSQTMIHGPTGSVIQGVYAKYFGVPLKSIAVALLGASRRRTPRSIRSPVTCPTGIAPCCETRKPWLLAGSLASVVACWFLFAPSGTVTMYYFGGWLLLAYAGWATAEAPHAGLHRPRSPPTTTSAPASPRGAGSRCTAAPWPLPRSPICPSSRPRSSPPAACAGLRTSRRLRCRYSRRWRFWSSRPARSPPSRPCRATPGAAWWGTARCCSSRCCSSCTTSRSV